MKSCIRCRHMFESDSWICPSCKYSPKQREGILSFIGDASHSDESFNEDFFPELNKLESNHFWFRYRNDLIVSLIKKYVPFARNVIEIGCGTGFVLTEINRRFPTLSLSGSDLHMHGLHFASRRLPRTVFYQMDAGAIPFRDEFHLVMVLDVLEHIENDMKALQEIHAALKARGSLLLTVPQHKWLWSVHDERACHKRRYTYQELKGKLESCGFEVAYKTPFIIFLLPVMLASRFYGNIFSRVREGHAPLRELKMSAVMNKMMSLVCSSEGYLLKKGWRFPVGGSLLCIGRKK